MMPYMTTHSATSFDYDTIYDNIGPVQFETHFEGPSIPSSQAEKEPIPPSLKNLT